MTDLDKAIDSFDYHIPNAVQIERIARNRKAYKDLVRVLFETCPPSADRTAAIRQLHESMMTANKSIVLE